MYVRKLHCIIQEEGAWPVNGCATCVCKKKPHTQAFDYTGTARTNVGCKNCKGGETSAVSNE